MASKSACVSPPTLTHLACQDTGCKKCSSPDSKNLCQDCFSDYLLSGSKCLKCDSEAAFCKSCSKTTANCSSCVGKKVLQSAESGKCIDACPKIDQFAFGESRVCTQCSTACKTCAVAADNCTACAAAGAVLLKNELSGKGYCLSSCLALNQFINREKGEC